MEAGLGGVTIKEEPVDDAVAVKAEPLSPVHCSHYPPFPSIQSGVTSTAHQLPQDTSAIEATVNSSYALSTADSHYCTEPSSANTKATSCHPVPTSALPTATSSHSSDTQAQSTVISARSEPNPLTARPEGRFSANRLANQNKTVDLSTYQYGLYSYFAEGNEDHAYDDPHYDPYIGQADIKDPALLLRAREYFEQLRRERREESEEYQMREQCGSARVHRPMYEVKRKRSRRLVVVIRKIPLSSVVRENLRDMYFGDQSPVGNSTSSQCTREDKLAEYVAAHRAGVVRVRSRPYSVHHDSSDDDMGESGANLYPSNRRVPHDASPNTSSCHHEHATSTVVKTEPADVSYLANPIFKIKQEIVDNSYDDNQTNSHHQPHKGSVAVSALSTEQTTNPLTVPIFQIKQEMFDPITNLQPVTTLPVTSTDCNTQESTLQPPLPETESITKKRKLVKRKKVCVPFAIKQEPVECSNEAPQPPVSDTPEEDETSLQAESQVGEAEQPQNVDSQEVPSEGDANVKIKEEQLDPEQMVDIFRKRVKKLKKIDVQPMVSVKEEPLDYEDDLAGVDLMPNIKEEPQEPDLLYFKPKPVTKHHQTFKRKPMFVYGRRIRQHAGMSTSHSRSAPSIDTEAEFDQAARISTPFSPPKSAWSRITETSAVSDSREDEETAGLTAQIDSLIEAGNIQSLDDTERMYHLFASTIRTLKDPTANVFNIVLAKFKKAKEPPAPPEKENPDEEASEEPEEPVNNQVLFPMSDDEIYNQGLGIVSETKPPEEFEMPSIKAEPQENANGEKLTGDSTSQPVGEKQAPESSADAALDQSGSSDEQHCSASRENNSSMYLNPHHCQPSDHSRSEPTDILNRSDQTFGIQPGLDSGAQNKAISFCNLPTDSLSLPSSGPRSAPSASITDTYVTTSVTQTSDPNPPATSHNNTTRSSSGEKSLDRQKGGLSTAEKLFDEVMAEEQNNYPVPEPTFLSEPFSRVNDNFFANSSFDDLIKVPLNTNEYLVKPKPSYVRMNYHNSSESVEGSKPPTVLFSAKPDEAKENAEWSQWKRNANNESFEQFQSSSSWTMEEQSNPWSPQPSIYDSYFEPPHSSSTSFEDTNREPYASKAVNFDSNPFFDGRRLPPVRGSLNPIIERNELGQDIIRIPVEQRTVQTQFSSDTPNSCTVIVSLPTLSFIAQRQDNVADIGTQTVDVPPYVSYYDFNSRPPLGSVLVEPLLSCPKKPVTRPPLLPPPVKTVATSSVVTVNGSDHTTVVQRTVQTQYPSNHTLYSSFEHSHPFLGYRNPVRNPADSFTQTEGAPLFPPWVAPGRFRKHRPVLVEPLPTIEPIGENVRTMRSSDAYSILMEQIRTSHDCTFDKFMKSQNQPNGIVSKFNKYACYAPQEGNTPELPLTVKKNYPKKASDHAHRGKRPGIMYKEVTPQPIPSEHSNQGLTPYQISVKIRKMGQVENIIGRLSDSKKRKSLSPKR